jgi:hypothetical protein
MPSIDGRPLVTISEATYLLVQARLPRVPAEPAILWLDHTCWVATYTDEAMQPEHFAGWECLNPVEEPPEASPYAALYD